MGGCPDSDGDGVSDPNDPCPNSSGLNGQPVLIVMETD